LSDIYARARKRYLLNTEMLKYFEVVRLILGLVDGADGQYIWRHTDIVIRVYHMLSEYTGRARR
jgi:hypothetical protein